MEAANTDNWDRCLPLGANSRSIEPYAPRTPFNIVERGGRTNPPSLRREISTGLEFVTMRDQKQCLPTDISPARRKPIYTAIELEETRG